MSISLILYTYRNHVSRVCSEHGRAGRRLRTHMVVTDSSEASRRRHGHEDHKRRILLGGFAGDAGRGHRTNPRRGPAGPVGSQVHDSLEHDTVGDLMDHHRSGPRPLCVVRGSGVGGYRRRCHFYRSANVHRRNSRGILYYTHTHTHTHTSMCINYV